VTVAVVDAYAAPTILSDANTYARRHGDDAFGRGQFSQIVQRPQRYGYDDTVNGDLCGEQGWYGEETLDVEAVHGMPPGANVLYVGGRSCDDFDLNDAVQTIVDHRLADVVTNSYGDIGEDLPADDIAANHATFVQAAIEGIGLLFSSGDDGDELVIDGARQVDFPASDPFVTAVGGTAIGIGRHGERLFETGWQTGTSALTGGAWSPTPPGSFLYGGGGGESHLYRQPAYQRGVVPRAISQYFPGPAGRAVPDIAAVGDPQTGMLVGETQTFSNGSVRYSEYRIGGTSLSSPLTAGIMALVDQARGRPLGFANPALYALAGSGAYHDIAGNGLRYVVRVNFVNGEDGSAGTTTILRSMNYPQTIFVRPGYDDVTGLGTPNAPSLVAASAADASGCRGGHRARSGSRRYAVRSASASAP
jgi:subtilase family serine protease